MKSTSRFRTPPTLVQRRKKNRRQREDLLSQIPVLFGFFACVSTAIAWMAYDRSAPRTHGVDALVGVREHAIDSSLATTALWLLGLTVLLSVLGLTAKSMRNRRKNDTWPVSLIFLAVCSCIGFAIIATKI